MKLFNRYLLTLLLLAGIGAVAASCTRSGGVAAVNTAADGLALRGFDTVAYYTAESAIKGDPKYSFAWRGATWYFASEENMNQFKANPEAYAPQFGGYCSYAVSQGYTADGDPQQWKVVDGKLYLNYNQKAKEAWEKEQGKFIKDGEKNWAEFQTKKPEHKG
jgi:YHS domain-containing protein